MAFAAVSIPTYEQLDVALVDEIPQDDSALKLGEDVGGGGDVNVYCLRSQQQVWIESKSQSNDTMTNVSETQRIREKFSLTLADGSTRNRIRAEDVFIDDIGIGRG